MLRFGTSGVPLTSRTPTTEDGIRRARELGLDALEMSWVNGIRMGPESAARIAALAREHDIALTAHAPYYVNLCGDDAVRARSIRRLVQAGELAQLCGAGSFCFHAGFFGQLDPDEARRLVVQGLSEITDRLRERGVAVDVRPELTGKPTQVGSFEDLLDWSAGVPGIRPCIDFSHQYARLQGAVNDFEFDIRRKARGVAAYLAQEKRFGSASHSEPQRSRQFRAPRRDLGIVSNQALSPECRGAESADPGAICRFWPHQSRDRSDR